MKQSKAFTLTELLVVVAVGAVLTTFLLAASNDAKQQLQAAACLNNMRQWGMGFMMYADDYNDYFPFDGNNVSPCDPQNVWAWYNVVPPYIGQKPLCQLYMAGTPPTPLTKGIWTCPSATLTNVAPTRLQPYFMYGMSSCWHQELNTQVGFRRNRMTSPTNTILFCEASEDNFGETNGKYLNLVPYSPSGGIAARHFAGANFVFGDGHAGWIAFTNFCRSGNAGCPFPGSNIEWDNSGPGGDWHPIVKYHWWLFKFANTSSQ
ncbi:MAG TPA: prepilin-type N-terminal cleavage/methylation domain-containing protein [Verrucomicrobiae bacterium]|nr:prepilin-type N-terminal cleavage/methylation domain-containing protein [Verrucomicrobiae bacterium]